MKIIIVVVILLTIIALSLITRPFTVLFHELGHAIVAILLTRRKVTIYIGSYGDPNSSLKLNLGALVIFFRYNPLAWLLGLCVPSAKSVPLNVQIAYTIAGPFASIVVGAIACYCVFTHDLHGALKLFFVVFMGSAILDFFANLIPDPTPIRLYDGTITYNDGYQLKQLLYLKKLPKEYSEAAVLYRAGNYSESAKLFEGMLCKGNKDDHIFRLAINAYFQDCNYQKAIELWEVFASNGKINSEDISNAALSFSFLGQNDKAMALYDKSLSLKPYNKYALNNKGYTLNLMGRFEEAIPIFDKIINFDRHFAYAYNNRGLAKIKMGFIEEGLQDIYHSLELDPNNSYSYLNLGIYHFDKAEYDEALQFFSKAKELDKTTYMVDRFINDVNIKLSY